jgi:HSP20 family protein
MTTSLQRNKQEQPATRENYILPTVNIREEKDAYVLEADMPGVNKKSLEITLEGSELTLIGRRPAEQITGDALLRERRQADYRRVFEIDPAIDSAGITAHMHQGLLTLTLPKSEGVKPRKITVNG